MKTDSSLNLYKKNFSLINRNIEITLKDNNVIKGQIIGFYKGVESSGESYIIKWHIRTDDRAVSEINEIFDALDGKVVDHNAIAEVKFEQDLSAMKFD